MTSKNGPSETSGARCEMCDDASRALVASVLYHAYKTAQAAQQLPDAPLPLRKAPPGTRFALMGIYALGFDKVHDEIDSFLDSAWCQALCDYVGVNYQEFLAVCRTPSLQSQGDVV